MRSEAGTAVKWMYKLGDGLEAVTLWFLAAAMGAMSLVVLAQVIARLTAGSLPWSEELARYLMIYLTYVGASVGVKRKSHIAITFLSGRVPRRLEGAVDLAGNLLCLAACAVILRFGWKLVSMTMAQRSPAMQIPMGAAYFSVVLGSALMAFHFLTNSVDSALTLLCRGGEEP